MIKPHAHIKIVKDRMGFRGHADIVRGGQKLGSIEHGLYQTEEEAQKDMKKVVRSLITSLSRPLHRKKAKVTKVSSK
jgi:hypothetical protein